MLYDKIVFLYFLVLMPQVTSKKGVNLPNTVLSTRVPTHKDVDDLRLIARLDPEYVCISFINDALDMNKVRGILKDFGNDTVKLIAKIERPQALKNLDEILLVSDGFMVARGDLGVEIPFEHLIPAQKLMINKANIAGKPVIVATQMLESMINAPVPTRAEVSDVYNAIEDGADAVMLSAETAAGKYPREAVDTMERVIRVSENYIPARNPDNYDAYTGNTTEAIGHLVHEVARRFGPVDPKNGVVSSNLKVCMPKRCVIIIMRYYYFNNVLFIYCCCICICQC